MVGNCPASSRRGRGYRLFLYCVQRPGYIIVGAGLQIEDVT
jgi:hypothetical protein